MHSRTWRAIAPKVGRYWNIAPRGHRFARLGGVSGADLVGETYVSYGRHSAFTRWLDDALQQTGIRLRTTIEVSASPALIEVVRRGAGVGLIESAALGAELARTLMVGPSCRS